MIDLLTRTHCGPVGLDLGERSLKFVQLEGRKRVHECYRVDIANHPEPADLVAALKQARERRHFRGRDVVLCISRRDLWVQNIRVPKSEGTDVQRLVIQEVASRLPFPIADAELRFVEAGEIRTGEQSQSETIVFAVAREKLQQLIDVAEKAGWEPIAVDVEPLAMIRAGAAQMRRESDQDARVMMVNVGYGHTMIAIAMGTDPLMVKYLDVGGRTFDEELSRHLEMPLAAAAKMRRQESDRRADRRDPEIVQAISEALEAAYERISQELLLCLRYHNVAFRGRAVTQLLIGGGEATAEMAVAFGEALNLPSTLSDPFRALETAPNDPRRSVWDVATGLAFREELA